MVTVFSVAGLPPAPATTEFSTARSLGAPVTPIVCPSSCLGLLEARLRDHRGEWALLERHDPDEAVSLLVGDRQIVKVQDREVHPAGCQQRDGICALTGYPYL